MLCDAGPLVALIDPNQPDHARCRAVADAASRPPISTWACFAEAMYLCGRIGGWPFQQTLWAMYERQVIVLQVHSGAEIARTRVLMEPYRNVPMDLADASLVAIAESLGDRDVFTVDSDFRIYRTADGGAFNILPT